MLRFCSWITETKLLKVIILKWMRGYNSFESAFLQPSFFPSQEPKEWKRPAAHAVPGTFVSPDSGSTMCLDYLHFCIRSGVFSATSGRTPQSPGYWNTSANGHNEPEYAARGWTGSRGEVTIRLKYAIGLRQMEITCNRCHQPVEAESCYCPNCGLPQLVYLNEGNPGPAQQEKWTEAIKDASVVEWKPALRAATLLAIPTGLLSCGVSPVGILGLFWMSVAAAWAVMIYMRSQRPAWITMGAGARIGFVTGLIAAWTAFAATGISLFAMRYLLGQGKSIDELWQRVVAQVSEQAMSPDPQTSAILKSWANWLRSPEAQAGWILGGMAMLAVAMLAFSAAGGALGARLLARSRRPEI